MKIGLLVISVLLLILSSFGFLDGILPIFQRGTGAIEGFTYGLFQRLPFLSESDRVKKLEEENLELHSKIYATDRLKKENVALLDQFQTSKPKSSILLPARVLGAPGFVPGVSSPSYFILDKGSADGVKEGQTVLVKDHFLGQVVEVSQYKVKVNLIYNPSFSFTGRAHSGALGIVKGDGTGLILDNVLLSDQIAVEDIVYTKGDMDFSRGILPDLIVGKIVSLEKKPSALFQKARVKSFVNFNTLSAVFIAVGEK